MAYSSAGYGIQAGPVKLFKFCFRNGRRIKQETGKRTSLVGFGRRSQRRALPQNYCSVQINAKEKTLDTNQRKEILERGIED